MAELEANEFMDADTLAEWLDVEKWTVVRMARLGKLPGRKIGKEWRFSRTAILEVFREPSANDEPPTDEEPTEEQ